MVVCRKCKTREGTETFVYDDVTFMLAHGMHDMRCKICCVEAQIKHAKRCAGNLPMFEKELQELREQNTN